MQCWETQLNEAGKETLHCSVIYVCSSNIYPSSYSDSMRMASIDCILYGKKRTFVPFSCIKGCIIELLIWTYTG